MTALVSSVQVANNVMYGKLYGYSDCCIRYFHLRQVNGDILDPDPPRRNWQGTGFICCPTCDSEKNEFQMHVEIAGKRQTKVPFMAHGEPSRAEKDKIHLVDDEIVALANSIIDEIKVYM